jgi:hypothetical protein
MNFPMTIERQTVIVRVERRLRWMLPCAIPLVLFLVTLSANLDPNLPAPAEGLLVPAVFPISAPMLAGLYFVGRRLDRRWFRHSVESWVPDTPPTYKWLSWETGIDAGYYAQDVGFYYEPGMRFPGYHWLSGYDPRWRRVMIDGEPTSVIELFGALYRKRGGTLEPISAS